VRLARDQELDLRSYLAAVPDHAAGPRRVDPVATVRAALAEVERRTGVRCELIVVEFPDRMDRGAIDALSGAVGEAVVNADKHGGARTATVCLDVDEEGRPVCTVNDDGTGFDVTRTPEGLGLQRSIRGRLGRPRRPRRGDLAHRPRLRGPTGAAPTMISPLITNPSTTVASAAMSTTEDP
jgi:hypothetical protein